MASNERNRRVTISYESGKLVITALFFLLLTSAFLITMTDVKPLDASLFFVFALLSISSLIISDMIYEDYFSPIGLYASTWCLMIGLSQLKLSYPAYQTNWKPITLIAVFGSFGSFLLGCTIAHRYTDTTKSSFSGSYSEERIIRPLIFLLFGAGFLSWSLMVTKTLIIHNLDYLLMIVSEYGQLRYIWITGVGFLYYLVFLAFILALVYGKRYGFDYKITAIILLSVLMFPFALRKSARVLFLVFTTFFAMNYTQLRRTIRINQLLTVLLGSIALFVLVKVAFTGGTGIPPIWKQATTSGKIDLPSFLSVLSWPYMYIAGNIDNLQVVLQTDINHTYGIQHLMPALQVTPIPDIVDLPSRNPVRDIYYGSRFTIKTYLSTLYVDFGIPGVLIIPGIYGLISTYVYVSFRKLATISSIVIYSIVAFIITFSFFKNFLTNSTILFIILGAGYLVHWIERKSLID